MSIDLRSIEDHVGFTAREDLVELARSEARRRTPLRAVNVQLAKQLA